VSGTKGSSKVVSLGPCILEGRHVRLEPLRQEHAQALFEATRLTDWQWTLSAMRSREEVDRRIAEGLEAEAKGDAYAFAVKLKEGGRIVGSTSYLTISSKHKRAEVGSTWYVKDVWGTAVNPECKYLLLSRAFEEWGAVRIQLITDVNNAHSQRAIMKLGAKPEGTLRNYGVRPDGTSREAVSIYSIIASEWPAVKSGLESRIRSSESS
jgi:N-acetyltransferase